MDISISRDPATNRMTIEVTGVDWAAGQGGELVGEIPRCEAVCRLCSFT